MDKTHSGVNKAHNGVFILLVLALAILANGNPLHAAANDVDHRGTLQPAPAVVSGYGNLPLSFEANQGQTEKAVRFLSRGSGYSLYLTPTEAVLTLKKAAKEKAPADINDQPSAKSKTGDVDRRFSPSLVGEGRGDGIRDAEPAATVRIKLIGANPSPKMEGEAALPGRVNYLIGKDPKKWRTNIPTFGKVRYEAIYSGIDLVYYGNQSQMEYDFVVAPGADPNKIGFDVVGAHGRAPLQTSSLRIADNGDLVLSVEGDEMRMKKPIIYQEIDGVRVPVSGGYRLSPSPRAGSHLAPSPLAGKGRGEGNSAPRVSFQIAAYDRSRPLVIDPVLVYSTYLGGGGDDQGLGIAVDSSGNAYVTGYTASTDFPIVGAAQASYGGSIADAFVTKLNPTGSALVYSTYLGGGKDDQGLGITVDSSGNAYVTGYTASTDFPIVGAAQASYGGSVTDAFVTKLNPTGSVIVYSTYLGGGRDDQGWGIAVDSSGSAYVTGYTASTNFPTVNPIQNVNHGIVDVFVVKLNGAGSGFIYSTYLGGTDTEKGRSIAVDLAGNVYVTGTTLSDDFPTANPFQAIRGGSLTDAFVTKLNAAGSALIYSTFLGGNSIDRGYGIAIDSAGNAYVTGRTSSTDFPTANPVQAVHGGEEDGFITKLNAAGSGLVYSTFLGGSSEDQGVGIAVDVSGSAYLTGYTYSTDFPNVNAIQTTYGNNTDAFVAKLNPAGSGLDYSTYLGSDHGDFGIGIAVDSSGGAYVIGSTLSPNFPVMGPVQGAYAGGYDGFIAKIVAPIDTPSAEVSVTNTGSPDPVTVGSSLTYTMTVTNNGPDAATGVTLTDTLPTGVTYVSATPSQGACLEAGGVVTCSLGDLANGAIATVTIGVTPTATGTLTNTATVADSVVDPNTANNSAMTTTTVNAVNTPPTIGALQQRIYDGICNGNEAIVAVGGSITTTSICLEASMSDADALQQVRLDVEVKPVGTVFTGTATLSSVLGPQGVKIVTVGGLTVGTSYHWQTRGVDDQELANAWTSFGTNLETAVDFKVTPPSAAYASAPNIVLIMTDDQRWDDLSLMPAVQAELVGKGVSFSNAFGTTPLCCPGRASIFTGLYAFHHGIQKNTMTGFDDTSTLATWLHDAGYRTSYIGKYFNGYNAFAPYVPPGWDDWRVFSQPYYVNYTLIENGVSVPYGSTDADYAVDVLKAKAVDFIQTTPSGQPLFLIFAANAPHNPAKAASRHKGLLSGIAPLRPPNYNEADVTDKPAWVQSLPLFTTAKSAQIDTGWKQALESLLSVDEAVAKIIQALDVAGRLNNTAILYTSDNGLANGEHRWTTKGCGYEECIRLPLLIRMPGQTTPVQEGRIALNIDLAPTIAELSGIALPSGVDGSSLVPLLDGSSSTWRSDFLIEYWSGGTQDPMPTWAGIRDQDWTYLEYSTAEQELYDLPTDPWQMTNIVSDPSQSARIAGFSARIQQLRSLAPLAITTQQIPDALAQVDYQSTLSATGGLSPYTWSMRSGVLPEGLMLDATGRIVGNPSVDGLFSFTVGVTDANATTLAVPLMVSIAPAVHIATLSLPSAAVGVNYLALLSAVDGTTPYGWSVSSGVLPNGLVLNGATGQITGTPTSGGTFLFDLSVTDANSVAATAPFTITVAPAVHITTTVLPSAAVGVSYSAVVSAADGTAPYGWSVSSGVLPNGLVLNGATGQITGTPTSGGTFPFDLRVTDANSVAATAPFTITVNADILTITWANWSASRLVLSVKATSSYGSSPTLTVVGFGNLNYSATTGAYQKAFASIGLNPGNITVTSTGGGQAVSSVTVTP